ncbi:MAG TPA: AsmA-like C-terminal domain-containing protein [Dongiaceae bacterium]|nr:AsmA-like C-terminal domain-containing protein [Dongiaceae bacterium]
MGRLKKGMPQGGGLRHQRQGYWRRPAVLFLEAVATLLGFAFLTFAVLTIWLIQAGPIELSFIKPLLERNLNREIGGIHVVLGRTVLAWGGWQRTMELRAFDLHLRDAQRELAVIPQLSIALSKTALLKGTVAPTRIELIEPSLTLTRRVDGSWAVATDGTVSSQAGDVNLGELARKFVTSTDQPEAISSLSQFGIRGGRVRLIDQFSGVTWQFAPLDMQVTRQGADVGGIMSVESRQFGSPARLLGEFHYNDQRVYTTWTTKGLEIGTLGLLVPEMTPLANSHLTLAARIRTAIDFNGMIDPVQIDIRGGSGEIVDSSLFAAPLLLKGIHLGMEFDLNKDHVRLDELNLDLGDHALRISGSIDGILGARPIAAEFALAGKNWTVASLVSAWPRGAADNARQWIAENISAGRIDEVTAAARLSLPRGEALTLDGLEGTFSGSDLTVHYLRPMPPIEGGAVRAHFDQHALTGQILAGHAGGIVIQSGQISFEALDQPDQWIDVRGQMNATVKEALQLLDNPRLGYASKLGLKPELAEGDAHVGLHIRFPALKDLGFDKVTIEAEADLANAGLKNALFGKDASQGALKLKVTNTDMLAAGELHLGSVPITMEWQENFTPRADMVRHVRARADVTADQAAELGFDYRTFLTGMAHGDITYEVDSHKRGTLTGSLTLDRMTLSVPLMHWQKPVGVPAQANIILLLDADRPRSISHFSLASADLDIIGKASFTDDGSTIRDAQFERIHLAGTNLANAGYRRDNDGYIFSLGSGTLDAEPLFKERKHRTPKDPNAPETPFKVQAQHLNSVRLGEDRALSDATIELEHDAHWWNIIKLSAQVGGSRLEFLYAPDAVGRHLLAVHTKDGGAAMKVLDITDSIKGGDLTIGGVAKDDEPGRPLRGTFRMGSYRLLNQPFLVRFFSVASLTGFIDALTGEGFLMDDTEATFTRTGGVLDVHSSHSTGPSLGGTACGRIDTDNNHIDMNGTLAPAYLVNGILDYVPVIGPWLQGGKGKGTFAFTFNLEGSLSEPQIDVNPLSLLTPGFLRNLFSDDDAGCGNDGKSKPANKKPAPHAPAPDRNNK